MRYLCSRKARLPVSSGLARLVILYLSSMIIVSNRARIDQLVHKRKRRMLLWLGGILLLTLAVFIFVSKLVLMCIPLLVLMLFPIVFLLRFKPYFHCFTDDAKLHIWFRVQRDNNRDIRRQALKSADERLVIYLNTIYGYESHSFFTGEQQLICLLLRTREGIVRTQPIPVEHLDAAEREQFYSYLDQLISGNKRRLPLPEQALLQQSAQGYLS